MFAAETAAFLESGCGLILGTVASDGEPHAARGFGLTVLGADRTRVRLLLDADDVSALVRLRETGQIAITAGNIRTSHSVQLKGIVRAIEVATDADRERGAEYCDALFTVIHDIDNIPRARLERLRPRDVVACVVAVNEIFDQTPGPGAGAALASPGSP